MWSESASNRNVEKHGHLFKEREELVVEKWEEIPKERSRWCSLRCQGKMDRPLVHGQGLRGAVAWRQRGLVGGWLWGSVKGGKQWIKFNR